MNFSETDISRLVKRLELPKGRLNMVLDTDTYNEVDDQFALIYALKSAERLNVEAIYAAPFFNDRSSGPGDGMEKSYEEILRLLGKINVSPKGFVFKGSDRYLMDSSSPVESEAARDLVVKAKLHSEENPLYVVAIGAITNVASAILMQPDIVNNIVIVWLGGHPLHWQNTQEFNLQQDIPAARVVFDSGAPVVQIPCLGVASHLLTTVPELESVLTGKNEVCDTLVKLFKEYSTDHFAWAKEIWDISAIAYLVNPEWVPTAIVHSPVVTDQCTWSRDERRHFIKSATYVKRNEIFRDMFSKLTR